MLNQPIGTHLIRLEETDSTNNYALMLLQENNPAHGTVIMTSYQHAGRGQRGATWASDRAKNLLLSYILHPSTLAASEFFLINQIFSVAIAGFIQSLTSSRVFIKWPNDIFVSDRKIAGILIENSIRNNKLVSTVAGAGININQTDFGNLQFMATSLALLEGKQFDIFYCLEVLNRQMNMWYLNLETGNHTKIKNAYSDLLYRKGIPSEFVSGQEHFDGVILGVNRHGQLHIRRNDGTDVYFNNKEVTIII